MRRGLCYRLMPANKPQKDLYIMNVLPDTHSNTNSSEALKQSREETWAAKAEFDEYKACT